MTLDTLKKLGRYIKLGSICAEIGIDYDAFRVRLSRGAPELTTVESKQFEKAINKLIIKKVGK